MAYDYATEKPGIFTEDGLALYTKIRDQVKALLDEAGAVRMQEAIHGMSGSSWLMLACVDHMVEVGELAEITPPEKYTPGQYRVFVAA